jgi:ligand-binding sensor domain-containing protein
LKLFYLILFICLYAPVGAQQYNYVQYTEKDGLAGSTVYDMCQDKDGFMWFATESGLSRYDGTRFVNFTTKDGLPDNEVLKVFADSKGRVWIVTFKNEVNYYYKGKIYDKRNDTLLAKVSLASVRVTIAESKSGKIFIADEENVTIISSTGEVEKVMGTQLTGSANNSFSIFGDEVFFFLSEKISKQHFIYNEERGKFVLLFLPKNVGFTKKEINILFPIYRNSKQQVVNLPFKRGHNSFTGHNGKLTWISTDRGAWEVDTINLKWGDLFLPNKPVSHTLTDNEQNTWFSTFGEGVYKLSSMSFKTLVPQEKEGTSDIGIYAFEKYKQDIIAGTGYNRANLVRNLAMAGNFDFSEAYKLASNPIQNNRLYTIKTLSNDVCVLGFDAFLVKLGSGKPLVKYTYPIKSIAQIDSNFILVGTGFCAVKMKISDLSIVDTVWKTRATKVHYANQHYYIGTINGLYEVNMDKTYTFLGDRHKPLSRRIVDIKEDENRILWIATSDAGIVGYKNGAIVRTIDEKQGLASDICKTLFWQPPYLWVGTNKGLSKINTGSPNRPAINYSISDGLASDFVNAVYVQDSMVYVGTPAGITVFNENTVRLSSRCNLNLLGVKISGRDTAILDNYALSWRNNSIGFEYVAISLKSAGDIVYRYKLQGLDTAWLQTRNTNINYPSLPAGDYIFMIQGVNKFGVASNTIQIKFTINAPIWKKLWFYLLLSALAMALALWVMQRRNKQLRTRLEEKNRVQKQFAELEQQALQSQMNPHFIFNCLNSIQQFIVLSDIPAANKYLTAFARLIRQTLDNSAKKMLSIEEEVAYLSSYLEMEQMRFSDRFAYTIEVDRHIDKNEDGIPAMLLQPFVENSIRHGLANRTLANGLLKIAFFKEGNNVVCIVTDNGIGRQESIKRKSATHIEYQSKGMSLTQKRIDLINSTRQSHIQLTIKDLYNPDHTAAGTEVTIIIPQ